jgi:hypothetical protein
MTTDPKWRVIAKRSGRPLSEVIAVFVFMMTNAGGNKDERGTLIGWSDEDVAAALDAEPEHVEAIRNAMQGKTLEGDRLAGWEKRQPKREDDTAIQRVKAFRERKSEMKRNETQCNAVFAPDADTDTDTEKKESARERASASPSGFDEFWALYPNKVGKDAAAASYRKALKRESHTEIMGGLRRYRAKTDDRPWCNPDTWLNQGRWADQPAGTGSLPAASSGDPVRETVFVEIDTPAWRAWAAHRGRSPPTRDLRTPAGIKRGWDFETEFPDMEGARA